MRLVVDTFEFGSSFTPCFNTISVSGYDICEAGSTALQELAFTIYHGVKYVEGGALKKRLSRGPNSSTLSPGRRTATAKNPRSWLMRFHTHDGAATTEQHRPSRAASDGSRTGRNAIAPYRWLR
jgi:hypothetical protein